MSVVKNGVLFSSSIPAGTLRTLASGTWGTSLRLLILERIAGKPPFLFSFRQRTGLRSRLDGGFVIDGIVHFPIFVILVFTGLAQ